MTAVAKQAFFNKEVQEFIRRLNSRTGRNFSLPTEAQWEYAARGGNKSKGCKFATGTNSPADIWYNKEELGTTRVGKSKVTNELGLYHMSGNVSEWCLDVYDKDFYNDSNGAIDPIYKDPNDNLHVNRGGCFSDDAQGVNVYIRSANRKARGYIGFRLVEKLN